MFKTLIIYSSTDGQTKIICERIKKVLRKGEKIEIVSLSEIQNYNLSSYSKIIIGASIRYGKHNPEIYNLIKLNKKTLNDKSSAFFSVNVVARKPEKNTPDTNPYMKKFLKISAWKPDRLAVFAGKVDYPKYSFFDKHIIQFIMFITKGPTDISKSYEFTDWEKVEKFAEEIDRLT